RTEIAASRQRVLREDLAPGVDGIAGEAWRDMAAAVQRGDAEGVLEPVERQRTREADDVTAIDEALAEPARPLGMEIEVDARRVLVEPRRHRMLGLLDRHPRGARRVILRPSACRRCVA